MYREPLDIYDERPAAMVAYLRHNGMHFNGKAQEFAASHMRKMNPATRKTERIDAWSKEQVDDLLKRNGITLNNAVGQDYVFVANMAKADFLGSSIEDETHLAKDVKDVVDDPDQADGFIFNRWYADMVRSGVPVDWEGIL